MKSMEMFLKIIKYSVKMWPNYFALGVLNQNLAVISHTFNCITLAFNLLANSIITYPQKKMK
jgi:hypothetical protein